MDLDITQAIRQKMFSELDHLRSTKNRWEVSKKKAEDDWLSSGNDADKEKHDIITEHLQMLIHRIQKIERQLLESVD